MTAAELPHEDETRTVTRTFTRADVLAFADLSGDTQPRHTGTADSSQPLLVHGLLTATLPTEIGGDLAVLARSMTFDFRKPVYTGETITCEWTTDSIDERDDRYDIAGRIECIRVAGDDRDVVMTGSVEGIIWRDDGDPVADG